MLDHSLPGILRDTGILQNIGKLIAVPDARHTERGGADEPEIIAVVGGAGLSDNIRIDIGHPAHCRTVGIVDGAVQELIHNGGVFLTGHPLAGVYLRAVIQEHITLMILYVIIGNRLVINAAVGEDLIGRHHIPNGHAVLLAAQSHAGNIVRVLFRQGGKMQAVYQPIITSLRGNITAYPGRRSVLRNLNGSIHILGASLLPVKGLGARVGVSLAERVGTRFVLDHGTEIDFSLV